MRDSIVSSAVSGRRKNGKISTQDDNDMVQCLFDIVVAPLTEKDCQIEDSDRGLSALGSKDSDLI